MAMSDQTPSAFHREPTFYTTTNAAQTGYNTPDRERMVMVDGKPVRDRHPQSGHLGEYDRPIRMRGEGNRWITVCKTNGSVIRHVITAGAGDMNPNSEFAIERRQKARALGWFYWGGCPTALARTGHMTRGHFADPALYEAEPCQPGTYSLDKPCPHAVAERDARRAKHNAVEAERAAAHKSTADKNLEQQSALLQTIANLQIQLARGATAASSPDEDPAAKPPTKPEKPEKK